MVWDAFQPKLDNDMIYSGKHKVEKMRQNSVKIR